MRTKVFPAVYLPALDETQDKDVSCNYMVARETVYRSYLKHWLKHEALYKFVQDYTKESRPIMAPHDLCSIIRISQVCREQHPRSPVRHFLLLRTILSAF